MKFKIEDLRLKIDGRIWKWFLLFTICYSLFAAFTGCERNSTFKDSISFQGYVNYGHMGTDAVGNSVLISDGPLSNASVICEGHPEAAKTKTDGSYTLVVKTVREFKGLNSEQYTLWAFTSTGGDEKVSYTAVGKPGDTINVRSFVLYKHTEE